ncbi:LytTR family DNA-binding domain-containing protein [Algoriphagus sp. NF]|jgi:two-component system LytT family response regulator|uniref:LytTR family DNA-binding domain-containing protein n=1 Tax=Algoriphagus marincola TaxID=264027 RepID=A0ABS7N0D4_9BACT|nr:MULTISPECIES: LytTR family DNA-binding domain-containing protein [Algoriphagus]MBY5949781.1 LytTR family DNA-binding domain-containing protein [Algoriphagus marincola]MCR9081618.1 LytTR family DNA-binding domain-containing protein [Cyclobacteriaceae bacterium]MDE0558976.1 LytTR family DNA-binding domain-containing protein [Algoriphagus sp. NF]
MNPKITALIVEDEFHSRETLKGFLREYCPEVQLVEEATNVDDAVNKIAVHRPELIFLDIELQTGTGFDVLQRLNHLNFQLIFTTAFEHYAIKAIKFSSLDYLLKPIDLEELQAAVQKAIERKESENRQELIENLLGNLTNPQSEHQKICLSTAEGVEFIPIKDILFCEAAGSYTKFFLSGGKELLVSKNLKEYEIILQNQHFMRTHNSFLINLQEVKKYVRSDGGYIIMNGGKQANLSPSKKDEFLKRMGF